MSTCTISASAVSNGPRLKDSKIMPFQKKRDSSYCTSFASECAKKKSLFGSYIVMPSINGKGCGHLKASAYRAAERSKTDGKTVRFNNARHLYGIQNASLKPFVGLCVPKINTYIHK